MTPIGFCAVYDFFSYPDKSRMRISQFFVLPNHQKRGIGTRFLTCVYQNFWNNPSIKDITVESPSTVFSYVRSMVETRSLVLKAGIDPTTLPKFLTPELEARIADELKLSTERSRVVYDIWRRRIYGTNQPEIADDIKNRLKREYIVSVYDFCRKNYFWVCQFRGEFYVVEKCTKFCLLVLDFFFLELFREVYTKKMRFSIAFFALQSSISKFSIRFNKKKYELCCLCVQHSIR